MTERIDVRGLSCPQPVYLTKKMMKKNGTGRIEVITDCGTSVDNLTRLARDNKWNIEKRSKGEDTLLILSKETE